MSPNFPKSVYIFQSVAETFLMGADILNLKRKLGVHSKNRTSVQLGYSTWTKRRWDHGVGGGWGGGGVVGVVASGDGIWRWAVLCINSANEMHKGAYRGSLLK